MLDNPAKARLLESLKTEVHVWYCSPDVIRGEDKLSAYISVLSADELERYHRFHFDKDRQNYLVTHVLLRSALSNYVDVTASQWQFIDGDKGKPGLVQQAGLPNFDFNITHTDGLSACVIALNRLVGIDAECVKRQNKVAAIAQRMFAEQELANLKASENSQQVFYYYWTLREAYVKALGTGLAGSSKDYYFDLALNGKNAVIRNATSQQEEIKGWDFRLYQPTAEHVLSVAFESSPSVLVRMFESIPSV